MATDSDVSSAPDRGSSAPEGGSPAPADGLPDPAGLEAAIAKNSFTGVFAIDRGDEQILTRCEGFAHRALGVPTARSTRFAIASGSKTFTALAVLRLVEQGVLSLETRVRSILGDDIPLIDDRVSIEHLLTHTSGIGDYIDEAADWDAADYVLPVPVHTLADTEAFVPIIDGFPQVFEPGERFSYCNGGYIVLAVIAQRASGREFHELVQQEVCDRAGLAHTAFLRSDDLPADAALGYLFEDGNRTNVLHLPVQGNGDGGIYTTADDVHAFWRAFLDDRIVSTSTVAEMIRPRSDVPSEGLRYGMGVYLHATGPQLIMEGYDAGVSFRSTHDPRSSTTTSVLGNSSEGAWPVIFLMADEPGDDDEPGASER